MSRLLVVDGNSIMNRAFYGIMGSKMLMTKDGTYTNAVYGFLAIIFKVIDDLKPEYMAVAFDLKAPTARHKMYEGYKANRHGMPDELAAQMPIIKDVLRAMNITIIEKEGYEADDVLGTLAKTGEADGVDVTILSGDRDTFQLATDKVTIRIPRTKAGKTEEDDFDRNKVIETYGVEPKQLIEVKGLMGDTSDNIPGVPGIGEKTALNLIKEYKTIENLYKCLDEGTADSVKGKMKEKITENKELAELSRFLGTINVEVPIDEKIDDLKVKDWNNELVFDIFKELNFNRFIDRFNLGNFQEKKEVKKETGCCCGSTAPKAEEIGCCCGSAPKAENTCCCGKNTIKVLGSGCKNCHDLYEASKTAVQNLGLAIEVEYVTDMEKIMEYGVMSMPALVVNEKVVSMGKVLKATDVEKLLHKLGF